MYLHINTGMHFVQIHFVVMYIEEFSQMARVPVVLSLFELDLVKGTIGHL